MTSLNMPTASTDEAPVTTDELPTFADVRAAAERIRGTAVRTPLIESSLLNERVGGRVLIKPECLQRTGSFKFRGAYNKISGLAADVRQNGVVAYSSGNHAQGVAAAAQLLDTAATIVMPLDAPGIKLANTRGYGATVVTYDRYTEDRAAIAKEIAETSGGTVVPPYDDTFIVSGQGTVGLEIAEQCREREVTPDAVLVCCGGGGLVSGTALALDHEMPGLPVYAVEPEDFDDTKRSLESGKRESVDPDARSICDALLSKQPGRVTFAINQRLLAGVLTVSDAEAKAAMRAAFLDLKVVAEPGGAVALAAALQGRIDIKGKTVVAVISGGNVDPDLFATALA